MTPFLALLLVTALGNLARDYKIAMLGLLFFFAAMIIAFLGLMVPQLRYFRVIGVASYALLVQVAMMCGILRGLIRNANPKWEHAQRFPV